MAFAGLQPWAMFSDAMGTFLGSLWRRLSSRSLPKDCLCNMRFAVFGLGDSGYAKYNATARKLHARLLQLGASELVSCRLLKAFYSAVNATAVPGR